jgi:7-cyano-7-deazaguanine synthase
MNEPLRGRALGTDKTGIHHRPVKAFNMSSLVQPATGLMLSGGVDSAVLLDQLVDRGWQVVPFYIRTDCIWQDAEVAAIEQFLAAIARSELRELVVLNMPLADLYGNHWSITGKGVPDDASPDEAVFLPGRNQLLLIKPVLWCALHGVENLALATLASNPFDDATPEFFTRFEKMVRVGTGATVQIARPFEKLTKSRVMELGRHLPLALTFSCLSPADGLHCGQCNKCAERRLAFSRSGIEDSTEYASTLVAATLRDADGSR